MKISKFTQRIFKNEFEKSSIKILEISNKEEAIDNLFLKKIPEDKNNFFSKNLFSESEQIFHS